MDDEEARAKKEYPLSPAKMSKTPSWIMLGFVLGALCVTALRRGEKKTPPAPEPARKIDLKPEAPRAPRPLTVIEAVFEEWARYAVWSDDTTEVALWNREDNAFTDLYEVRRIDGVRYYRTIPRLTRRIIKHPRSLPDSPLQFTETEEQYRVWREHGVDARTAEETPREFRPAPGATPADRPIKITAPRAQPPTIERVVPPWDAAPGERAGTKK